MKKSKTRTRGKTIGDPLSNEVNFTKGGSQSKQRKGGGGQSSSRSQGVPKKTYQQRREATRRSEAVNLKWGHLREQPSFNSEAENSCSGKKSNCDIPWKRKRAGRIQNSSKKEETCRRRGGEKGLAKGMGERWGSVVPKKAVPLSKKNPIKGKSHYAGHN